MSIKSCIVILLVVVLVIQIYRLIMTFKKAQEEYYYASTSNNDLERYVGIGMKNGEPVQINLVDFFPAEKRGNMSMIPLQRETKYPKLGGYIVSKYSPGNSSSFTYDESKKLMKLGNNYLAEYSISPEGVLTIPKLINGMDLVCPGRVRFKTNGLLSTGFEVLHVGESNNYMFNMLGIYADRLVIESVPFQLEKSTDSVLTKKASNISETINVEVPKGVSEVKVGDLTIQFDSNTKTLDFLKNSQPIHSFPVM